MLSNTDLFVITYHDDYVEIRDFKMQRILMGHIASIKLNSTVYN